MDGRNWASNVTAGHAVDEVGVANVALPLGAGANIPAPDGLVPGAGEEEGM